MFKPLLKQWIGNLMGLTVLPLVMRDRTVIFMFHRVLTEEEYNQCHFGRSIAVTDKGLERFLIHIKKRFEITALSELINGKEEKNQSNKPRAVITFDDGWKDNYTIGFPILKKHNVPATIFLSTDFIDSDLGFWWQHLGEILSNPAHSDQTLQDIWDLIIDITGENPTTIEALRHDIDQLTEHIKQHHYPKAIEITRAAAARCGHSLTAHGLSWADCAEMSNQGIEFGSHTLSHPRLSLLKSNELNRELVESKSLLESKNINYVNAICYPYGDYSEDTANVSQAHYALGLTTNSGIVSAIDDNKLKLPRINVPLSITQQTALLDYRLTKAAMTKAATKRAST